MDDKDKEVPVEVDTTVVVDNAADLPPPKTLADFIHKYKPNTRILGSMYVLTSALIFSVNTLLAEQIGERSGTPSFEIVFVRCVIQALYSAIICFFFVDINPFGEKGNRLLPILRGLIGPISAGCLYYGATTIAMSDATALLFSSPIWTPFVARLVVKEQFRVINFVSIGLGLIGVLCIAQPAFVFDFLMSKITGEPYTRPEQDENDRIAEPGSARYTISAIVCLFGAVCSAFVYSIIRKTGGSVHFQVLVFYYGFAGGIFSFLFVLLFQRPFILPDKLSILYLILIGLLGSFGQSFLNKGAQMIDASKTAVLRNADIAFVLILQVFLLQQLPTIFSWIGLILISVCTVIISFTKAATPPPVKTKTPTSFKQIELDVIESADTQTDDSIIDEENTVAGDDIIEEDDGDNVGNVYNTQDEKSEDIIEDEIVEHVEPPTEEEEHVHHRAV